MTRYYDQYDEAWLRNWAKRLTTNPPPPDVIARVLDALRRGHVQPVISHHPDDEEPRP